MRVPVAKLFVFPGPGAKPDWQATSPPLKKDFIQLDASTKARLESFLLLIVYAVSHQRESPAVTLGTCRDKWNGVPLDRTDHEWW